MDKKIKVTVLCGGRSGEHEVSLLSAKSVISALDHAKYEILVIGISKDGTWRLMDDEKNFLTNPDDAERIALVDYGEEIFISPTPGESPFQTKTKDLPVDVIFPVLHGTYGEDGTLQGMLDMLDVPYVGANYLGSAAAMDKDVAKRLFKEAGIPTARHLVFRREEKTPQIAEVISAVEAALSYPVFVKPANLGSSVGIGKAANAGSLENALLDAWQYDTKIIVEQGINGREIECSLLGNDHLRVSELGEIIPEHHEFYSYEAKYLDPNGAKLVVGVTDIDPAVKREVQELAKKAFAALGCEGMARADFLVERGTNRVYINEINTIPGFTKISMYPKLWEKSGVSYTELLDSLIELALKRHNVRSKLKTDFKK